MNSNIIIANRYRILHKLGEGGSGITYKALDLTTTKYVAVKVLSLRHIQEWKQIELFEREASILQQLDYPSIPKYLDYFQVDTENDRLFYIVREFAVGYSLATLVEERSWQPDEATVKQITIQILEVLVYLQQEIPPVIHRDIKPENLVYRFGKNKSTGTISLIDFGAVREIYHNTVIGKTIVGTYGYMAPEQLRGQAYLSTDLYGLGMTLILLLTGQYPSELPQKKLKIDFRASVRVSKDFGNWLDRLVEPNYKNRIPSAEVALEILRGRKSLTDTKLEYEKPTDIQTIKTKNKLVITIPPVCQRNRYNRTMIYQTYAWFAFLWLAIVGISASTHLLWGLLYLSCLLIEFLIVNEQYIPKIKYLKLGLLIVSIIHFSLNNHSVGLFNFCFYLLLFVDTLFRAINKKKRNILRIFLSKATVEINKNFARISFEFLFFKIDQNQFSLTEIKKIIGFQGVSSYNYFKKCWLQQEIHSSFSNLIELLIYSDRLWLKKEITNFLSTRQKL